ARADERDLGQGWVHELVSHADIRTLRRGRLTEHVEQVGPALDELEQAPVRIELVGAHAAQEVGGAAYVQALFGRGEPRERRPERREERPLSLAQPGVLEAPPEQRRSELQPGDGLVA